MDLKYYSKFAFQSLIFIFEILLIVGGVTYLSSIIFPVSVMEFVERFLLFLTIYQLFVYATLKLYDDAQKDSLNTVRSNYEHALIYFELLSYNPGGAILYKDTIKKHIPLISDDSFLNTKEVIKFYNELNNALDENDLLMVKIHLVNINHNINLLDLEFMHSFFLRGYKSMTPKVGKEYIKENNIEI